MKLLSTADFIEKAKLVHGDRYDYSKLIYTKAKEKISVGCKKHLVFFELTANSHLNGHGCKLCGDERTGESQKRYKEDYVAEFRKIHNGKYDYSKSVFGLAKEKIEITCPSHKSFWQTPDKHRKQGCPACAKISHGLSKRETLDSFVDKARKIHGNKYEYISVDFIASKTIATIICYDHGVFTQISANHLSGRGCSSCCKTGYDNSKEGILYLLSHENLFKIGITNLSAIERCKKISKSSGKKFGIVQTWKCNEGKVISDVETSLLRLMRGLYKQPDDRFEGHSESFYDIELDYIITVIDEELKCQQNQTFSIAV